MTNETTLPLLFERGHLFVDLPDGYWLLDTGSPTTFGAHGMLPLGTARLPVVDAYGGLSVEDLARLTGVSCVGLIGADVMGELDWLLDVPAQHATLSPDHLALAGEEVPMRSAYGIPIISACVLGAVHHLFLDTGAQLSYLENASQLEGRDLGTLQDFYPGIGTFETRARLVDIAIGATMISLKCGQLPPTLSATLALAGVTGILGNELLADRALGYFPRRHQLVIGTRGV